MNECCWIISQSEMGPRQPSSLSLCKMEARGPYLFLPQTYNNLFGNTDFSSESSGIDL